MLDFMRRQHSRLKWVWVIIIFIFAVTLITFYIPMSDLGAVTVSGDVAEVGSESISAREFRNLYQNYVQRVQVPFEVRRAFGFERQVIDYLISQRVMRAEAARLGLRVTPEEVARAILSNPVFLQDGKFVGQQRYQEILQSATPPMTVADFEAGVEAELLQNKLLSFITAGVVITDEEVEQEYRRRNEKVKIDYFVIDPAKLESQVTVSDKEQRDYYEKNKASYNVPEKRKARVLFVDAVKQRAALTATDQELQAYFDQHQEEYRLPDRVTAQHILFKTEGKKPEEIEKIREKARGVLERARKGEDFGALAKQFSEDTSAARGGDLGSFGRGQMVREFEQAAFSLGPGAISDIVQTQFGFHIIKVNERQEGRLRTLDELKEAIRIIVLQRKGEEKARQVSQQAAVELVNNKDFNAVAQKFGAEVIETPLFEQNETLPELGTAPDFHKRVFSMAKDEIGTAIQVERGYAIPMVTEIQPAHPASFEEAQSRVLADVKSQKAKELGARKGKQIQEEYKAGKTLAALAKIAGETIKTSPLLTRGGSIPEFGALTDREDELFSLPVGKTGTPSTSELAGKTFVFAIKERTEIKPDEMKKSLESLRKEMLPQRQQKYFNAYLDEVRRRMEANGEIEVDEAALSQLAATIG